MLQKYTVLLCFMASMHIIGVNARDMAIILPRHTPPDLQSLYVYRASDDVAKKASANRYMRVKQAALFVSAATLPPLIKFGVDKKIIGLKVANVAFMGSVGVVNVAAGEIIKNRLCQIGVLVCGIVSALCFCPGE